MAAGAIAAGIAKVFPCWKIVQVPLADGGDGTTACIVRATGGRSTRKEVIVPLDERVTGFWGLTGDGATAVAEMAVASGLALAPPERLDPLRATSHITL